MRAPWISGGGSVGTEDLESAKLKQQAWPARRSYGQVPCRCPQKEKQLYVCVGVVCLECAGADQVSSHEGIRRIASSLGSEWM